MSAISSATDTPTEPDTNSAVGVGQAVKRVGVAVHECFRRLPPHLHRHATHLLDQAAKARSQHRRQTTGGAGGDVLGQVG